MDKTALANLLDAYRDGSVGLDAALEKLAGLPFEDLGFAVPDRHRSLRTGFPEVIFCQGKTPAQTAEIACALLRDNTTGLLATRASPEHFAAVREKCPGAAYHELPRLIQIRGADRRPPEGQEEQEAQEVQKVQSDQKAVLVVSAGTADLPVAEEAALVAEALSLRVTRLYDVGVAGLHRLLARMDAVRAAAVVIVVAGMEGALASVVGGLTDKPVIAVPTSVGYGASFGGLAALLAMLNSCAAGVGVMNIDNGFGAAFLAHRILSG
ncbi:MAG: nickel pincer cofactor biosynthesis protein LarB [Oscillospiraceae bacterium]|nr:nickel pincer cofactor biosynthesis protein LarB [Oscillospiraceae bacterium]